MQSHGKEANYRRAGRIRTCLDEICLPPASLLLNDLLFFLINFVDYHQIIYEEELGWYHLWLILMYFAPIAMICIFERVEGDTFLGSGYSFR